MKASLILSSFALAAQTAFCVHISDFAHAAVTDMYPGKMLPVTKIDVEGETPYLLEL